MTTNPEPNGTPSLTKASLGFVTSFTVLTSAAVLLASLAP